MFSRLWLFIRFVSSCLKCFQDRVVVIAGMVILSMVGCSSAPYPVNHSLTFSGAGPHKVHVVSHGWHTGFVVPSDAVYSELPVLKDRFKDSPSIEFGWGDRGFYQADEITAGLAVRAILTPTETVVHAVRVPTAVADYFPNSEISTICLTEEELKSLVRFIAHSFKLNQEGSVVPLREGIYGDSQFYVGEGNYHLMNTCNKWTANGLKSVGMDIAPSFKLTADSIMSYLASLQACENSAL